MARKRKARGTYAKGVRRGGGCPRGTVKRCYCRGARGSKYR